MAQTVRVQLDLPADMAKFRLPKGLQRRMNALLDKQDEGRPLTRAEKEEAEAIVDLNDTLSYLRLRTERLMRERFS